ncbi:hypothetical protein EXIGLDRAFT_729556 [Exidia glandulosa HHB12029]|uniref:Uncharacterized protein n=1 Tax=Exidia glandulosa HHB12029 TaxID=1314781 RepID=A0A165CIQ6_EXIGL|nr:hypothetical protein EXIGLDRAFT_729556 [Exidia glandulosa HHB12029]
MSNAQPVIPHSSPRSIGVVTRQAARDASTGILHPHPHPPKPPPNAQFTVAREGRNESSRRNAPSSRFFANRASTPPRACSNTCGDAMAYCSKD